MTTESVAAKVHGSPTRCPVCQESVDTAGPDWLACANCMSRHHLGCWQEGGCCGACGMSQPLRVEGTAPSESGARAASPTPALEAGAGSAGRSADSDFESGRDPLLRWSLGVVLALVAWNLFSFLSGMRLEFANFGAVTWMLALLHFAAKGTLIYATVKSRGRSRNLGVLALFLAMLPGTLGSLMFSESWSIVRQILYYIVPNAIKRMFDWMIAITVTEGFVFLGLIVVFRSLGRSPVLDPRERDRNVAAKADKALSGKDDGLS